MPLKNPHMTGEVFLICRPGVCGFFFVMENQLWRSSVACQCLCDSYAHQTCSRLQTFTANYVCGKQLLLNNNKLTFHLVRRQRILNTNVCKLDLAMPASWFVAYLYFIYFMVRTNITLIKVYYNSQIIVKFCSLCVFPVSSHLCSKRITFSNCSLMLTVGGKHKKVWIALRTFANGNKRLRSWMHVSALSS